MINFSGTRLAESASNNKLFIGENKMFKTARLAAILLSSATLSGCVVAIGNDAFQEDEAWQQTQKRNDRYIESVLIGTSINAIRADLGEADFQDSFQRNGEVFEVLYYRTQHRHSDGKTTRDETTPLVFIEGALVGYGPTAVENATR